VIKACVLCFTHTHFLKSTIFDISPLSLCLLSLLFPHADSLSLGLYSLLTSSACSFLLFLLCFLLLSLSLFYVFLDISVCATALASKRICFAETPIKQIKKRKEKKDQLSRPLFLLLLLLQEAPFILGSVFLFALSRFLLFFLFLLLL
jgi:hypothetical protein